MTVLAMVAGVGLGAAYSHFYLPQQTILWTIAISAVGAILGFVLILMPGTLVQYIRKLSYAFAVSRRTGDLGAVLTRADTRLSTEVEDDPDNAAALEALGVVALMRGERQSAAHYLERACELDAAGPSCCINLATALVEVREFDRAAGLLMDAGADLDSATSGAMADVAQHNLGVLLSRKPPIGVMDRVLVRMDPLKYPDMLNGFGIYEMNRGEFELAEKYFAQACDADPAGVAPRANLAILAHRRGNLDEALARAKDAGLLDPVNPAIHNDFGAFLCAAGQAVAAARELARASLLQPGSAAVELNRGTVHLLLGHYDDALDSFHNPTVRDEYPVQAAHNAALALIGEGREEAALEEIEQAIALAENAPAIAGDDAALHTNAGCVAWVLGDDARMAEELDRAAAAPDESVAATNNLAAARIIKGRAAEAVTLLERMAERHRNDTTVTFHLGLAYLADALAGYRHDMSRTERQDFFRSLHRAVRPLDAVANAATECSHEALANLGLYRYLRQQYDEAVAAFEEVAEDYPEDSYLQFAIGTCLAEQAAALQVSHGAAGDELVGQARELLVRARRHFTNASDLGEASGDQHCNLGMAAYNLGDMAGARQAFRKMLQVEGGGDAANNLAIVYAKEAAKLQAQAKSVALVSEDRRQDMTEQMRTAISTALHYFHKALELDRDNPLLHGNIGLAYMIRNRENDVESALRHWQHMRQVGGAAQEKRYEQLTALVEAKEGTRAEFDETLMSFRRLDPIRSLTAPPPSLVGTRYAIQPITQESDWLLQTQDAEVRRALRLRERIHGLKQRMARLGL
jgi:Flp pilus assembly protein TadD